MKKRTTRLLVVAWSALVSFIASPAMSKPVTSADLTGKKICWDSGDAWTFSPGGKFNSTEYGAGTWAVGALGVELRTTTGGNIATIDKLADGTFKYKTVLNGGTVDLAGRACK